MTAPNSHVISPDSLGYDFNTPTPLQPRVLDFEDAIGDDDARALREAEAEEDRRRDDPHWGNDDLFKEWDGTRTSQELALRDAHLRRANVTDEHSSTDSGSIRSVTPSPIVEEPNDDVIFVEELTREQAEQRAAWSTVRKATTNQIFAVIDICYEVLAERGVDLGF